MRESKFSDCGVKLQAAAVSNRDNGDICFGQSFQKIRKASQSIVRGAYQIVGRAINNCGCRTQEHTPSAVGRTAGNGKGLRTV
jgi:hypothetical protein